MRSWFAQSAHLFLAWLWLSGAGAGAAAESTLQAVQKRGHLICGVSENAPGFSQIDDAGGWTGLEVDYCRALAAAVLGRSDAVSFVPLAGGVRFTALAIGQIDVLARDKALTPGRGTQLGLRFVGPLYHRGTALLVRQSQGVASPLELTGASFCLQAGSPARRHVAAFFGSRKMPFKIVAMETWSGVVMAYADKRCQVLAADVRTISAQHKSLGDGDQHMVLQDLIAQEPLGPVVRKGDEQWFEILRWTLYAMVGAEELGLSRANVDALRGNGNRAIGRFLGVDGDAGNALGLDAQWAYRIISQVGNYGESFARHLGSDSPMKLQRGLNDLWSRGGLLAAPPFR